MIFQWFSNVFNYLPWFSFIFLCFARPITPHVPLLPGKEEKKSKEDKDKTESGNPHDAGCGAWMGWILNGFETF